MCGETGSTHINGLEKKLRAESHHPRAKPEVSLPARHCHGITSDSFCHLQEGTFHLTPVCLDHKLHSPPPTLCFLHTQVDGYSLTVFSMFMWLNSRFLHVPHVGRILFFSTFPTWLTSCLIHVPCEAKPVFSPRSPHGEDLVRSINTETKGLLEGLSPCGSQPSWRGKRVLQTCIVPPGQLPSGVTPRPPVSAV